VVVNLSANQFGQSGLVTQVAAALASSGLAPEWLGLDVTENALMQHSEEAGAILWDLKQLGIRLCVDNFGTGCSSLSSLRHFPFDALKVDQTFVHTLSAHLPNQALVKSWWIWRTP
jgi:EAL domain-containing protein (putative c-di-GMP-specific phosphodiesterase class I)